MLARTDREGEATLAIPDPDAAMRIYVFKQGYLPQEVEQPLQSRQTVVLARGEELTVYSVTEAGQPVAGVRIAASQRRDTQVLRRAVVAGEPPTPGPSPAVAVFTAISDEQGIARLTGLPAGELCLHFHHDTHVMVRGVDRACGTVVPGPPLQLVWARAVGAVLVPGSCELLGYNVSWPRDEYELGNPWVNLQIAKSRDHLRAAFPDAKVWTKVPAEPRRRSGELPVMRMMVLLEPGGWQELRVPMRYVDEIDCPTVIEPADTTTVGSELVVHVDGDALCGMAGSMQVIDLVSRHTSNGYTGNAQRRLQLETPMRVPAGRHELVIMSPSVAHALESPPQLETFPGQRTEIQLDFKYRLVPCRLDFACDEGSSVPPLDLLITDSRGVETEFYLWVPEHGRDHPQFGALQWFPEGELIVEVGGELVVGSTERVVVRAEQGRECRLPVRIRVKDGAR